MTFRFTHYSYPRCDFCNERHNNGNIDECIEVFLCRIESAIEQAKEGSCDGAHHKDWVIHQIVRILGDYTDKEMDQWSKEAGFESQGTPP